MEGLARYACYTQTSHDVSKPWSDQPPEIQDALDEAAKILVKVGKGMSAAQLKVLTVDEILARAKKAKEENPDLFK